MSEDRAGKHADPRETGLELFDLLRRYVLQETVTPIKKAGRTLAFGGAAAVFISIGLVLLLVAVLRALQIETGSAFAGSWDWVPYLITAFVGLVLIGGCVAVVMRSSDGSSPKAQKA